MPGEIDPEAWLAESQEKLTPEGRFYVDVPGKDITNRVTGITVFRWHPFVNGRFTDQTKAALLKELQRIARDYFLH